MACLAVRDSPCRAFRHPAATCAIRIRPTTSSDVADYLTIAEMYLYDAAGARITPLSARLSTTINLNGIPRHCIDGDLTTWCSTVDDGYDDSPTLTVRYDCPGGKTTAARVVVHNRDEDCCRAALNPFSLDFVDASGQVDPQLTFSFSGSKPVYTVWSRRG